MTDHRSGLTEDEIRHILTFLAETDMTGSEIAERMNCSRADVLSINRRWQVRLFDVLHSTRKRSTASVGNDQQTRTSVPPSYRIFPCRPRAKD